MAGNDQKKKEAKAQAANANSRYRNPPQEYRYTKGSSGNPAGRPPKSRPQIDSNGLLLAPINEASRNLVVRDESGQQKVQAMALVMRKAVREAVSGDQRAQKFVTDEVRKSLRDLRQGEDRMFDDAVAYKALAEELCETATANYRGRPALRIEPDELILDAGSRTVELSSRNTSRRAGARRELRAILRELKQQRKAMSELYDRFRDNLTFVHDFDRLDGNIEDIERKLCADKEASK